VKRKQKQVTEGEIRSLLDRIVLSRYYWLIGFQDGREPKTSFGVIQMDATLIRLQVFLQKLLP